MRRQQNLAIERSDLGDAGAIRGKVRRMIAEMIFVVGLGCQAVGVDDLTAHAAVAASPMPGQRAGRMAGSLDGREDRVAEPHLLAVPQNVIDPDARKRFVDSLLW